MSVPLQQISDFNLSEGALVLLQELAMKGQDDTPEVDALHDQMDGAWNTLSGDERRRLKGLSADLYMLEGKEIQDRIVSEGDSATWKAELQRLNLEADWEGVLRLLRVRPKSFREAHAAYLRGRCYDELGEPTAAIAFLAFAFRLDPAKAIIASILLDLLQRCGRLKEALVEAKRFLESSEHVDPCLAITAAGIVQSAIDEGMEENTSATHQRLIEVVERALQDARSASLPVPVRSFGYTIAAHSSFAIGDFNRADRAYTEAIGLRSDDAEVFATRALVRMRTDAKAARADFERAVALNTMSPWAYGFLAHHALGEKDYERVLHLSERALVLTDNNDRLRAESLQYLAIARFELGHPKDAVRATFERALMLDPSNKTLRENFDVFDRRTKRAKKTDVPALWRFATTSILPIADEELMKAYRERNMEAMEVATAA